MDFGLELQPPDSRWFDYNLTRLESLQKYFSTVWICDHFQYAGSMPWFEGWTSLVYLSAKYPSFQFGNLVLSASYRNPAMVAKMAATCQYLTKGRLVLGIGAGWQKEEYEAYGYEFAPYAERIDRLEEAVKIIKTMWANSPASFEGKFYQIKNAYCEPKPQATIPILIGVGTNSRALKVVAKYADMYNEIARVPVIRTAREKLARICSETGRPIREIKLTALAIPYMPKDPREFEPEQEKSRNSLLGPDAESIIKELKDLEEIGVNHIQVRCKDRNSFDSFCEKVIPSIQN